MGTKLWSNEIVPVPLMREELKNSNWFLWILRGPDRKFDLILGSEMVYSTIYSRFLRVGNIVRSNGEWPPEIKKGTSGVLIGIQWPHQQGTTDYVFEVAFPGHLPVHVKQSHLIWESSQRIKIGKPAW